MMAPEQHMMNTYKVANQDLQAQVSMLREALEQSSKAFAQIRRLLYAYRQDWAADEELSDDHKVMRQVNHKAAEGLSICNLILNQFEESGTPDPNINVDIDLDLPDEIRLPLWLGNWLKANPRIIEALGSEDFRQRIEEMIGE